MASELEQANTLVIAYKSLSSNNSVMQRRSDDDEVNTKVGKPNVEQSPVRVSRRNTYCPQDWVDTGRLLVPNNQTDPGPSNYASGTTYWAFRGRPHLALFSAKTARPKREWWGGGSESTLPVKDDRKESPANGVLPTAPKIFARSIKVPKEMYPKCGEMFLPHPPDTQSHQRSTTHPKDGINGSRHLTALRPEACCTCNLLQRFFQNKTTDASTKLREQVPGAWATNDSSSSIDLGAYGQTDSGRHRRGGGKRKETNRESLIEVAQIIGRGFRGPPSHSKPGSSLLARDRLRAGRATRLDFESSPLDRPRSRPSGPPAYLGDRPLDKRCPFRKQATPGFKLVNGWPDELTICALYLSFPPDSQGLASQLFVKCEDWGVCGGYCSAGRWETLVRLCQDSEGRGKRGRLPPSACVSQRVKCGGVRGDIMKERVGKYVTIASSSLHSYNTLSTYAGTVIPCVTYPETRRNHHYSGVVVISVNQHAAAMPAQSARPQSRPGPNFPSCPTVTVLALQVLGVKFDRSFRFFKSENLHFTIQYSVTSQGI
ncbi:hypothetical protein BJY52DRAFT_1221869 [Lactarius psammicola]|nr:hypothetical protein BJY52DRAFT_1221869 [Lactarius psammicola]